MNTLLQSGLVRLGILLLGLGACYVSGSRLQKAGEHIAEPNVFCLKGSPFGKTIAMAMQGPVDVYWHEGAAHDQGGCSDAGCDDCDGHHSEEAPVDLEAGSAMTVSTGDHAHGNCGDGECTHGNCGHNHAPGESGVGCDHDKAATIANASEGSIKESLLKKIQDWRAETNTRHNPHANSDAHRHFIRREVEKKLMLTYRMDPTNYASYGAYFLFLSESSLSDRAGSVTHALRLSQATVQYCLQERESVTAMLTGAAAAHDAAQLLMQDPGPQAQAIAAQYVGVAENLLSGFEQTAMQMAFDGTWDKFSLRRQSEMTERARLLRKLVENSRKIDRGVNANHGREHGADAAG